ncbi:Cytochrome c biogenesis ATP-binding export protein CcmA [Methyloligella halotolerans]|uniref:Cytochrome c biogenesis ATP-binding export protein CcmA n=1 Tax=Methyloligella halotolerans TaxID=1177755 RepID=A0A1E2RVQ7_9HYPH|nr:heme ABC exporter ATP-binding protein CcmA [Methyloligella halotolerans]ODA66215.1 Cytochrome c biogenesis ATP-binding export protein CcmA [Methyloligella halotolerans]
MEVPQRLEAHDLACRRGLRLVFEGLSFALSAGEALLLTGPNGAGKTSLLRLMAGFLPAETGEVRLLPADEEKPFGEHVHYLGHANGVKASLTVSENLQFWIDYYGAPPLSDETIQAHLSRFGLAEIADLPAGMLSAGQKRKLALCRLLAAPRPVWLLDEPSVSLDAASTKILAAIIKDHLKAGGMAVVATHLPLSLRFAQNLDLSAREAA